MSAPNVYLVSAGNAPAELNVEKLNEVPSSSVGDITNSGAPHSSTGTGNPFTGLAASSPSAGGILSADQPSSTSTNTGEASSHATAGNTGASVLSGLTAGKEPSNEASAHVDSLATNLAGAVLTAPMAALEKIAPAVAERVSHASTLASQHASNAATSLQHNDTARNLAHQASAQAGSLGQQAYDTALGFKDAITARLPASLGGHGAQTATSTTTSTDHSTSSGSSATGAGAANTHRTDDDAVERAQAALGDLQKKTPHTSVGITPKGDEPHHRVVNTFSGTSGVEVADANTSSSYSGSSSSQQQPSGEDVIQRAKDALSNKATSSPYTGSGETPGPGVPNHTTVNTFTGLSGTRVADSPSTDGSLGQKASDTFHNSSKLSGIDSSASYTGSNNFSLTDSGRQGAGDKLSSSLKPDSQKTYTEQASDFVQDTADKGLSYLQPEENKSLGQKATDAFQ